MKKSWIIGFIALGVIIIALVVLIIAFWNHDSKSLKCVKAVTDNGTDRVSTFTFRFSDDEMEKVEAKNEIIVKSDAYKANLDVLYKNLETRFGGYKNEKGVLVKTSKGSDRVTLTLTVDAKQNPDRVEVVGSSIVGTMNYEDAKKELVSRGYECE